MRQFFLILVLISFNLLATTVSCTTKVLIENPDLYNGTFVVYKAVTETNEALSVHVPKNSTLEDVVAQGLEKKLPIINVNWENGIPTTIRAHKEKVESTKLTLIKQEGSNWVALYEHLNYQTGALFLQDLLCQVSK